MYISPQQFKDVDVPTTATSSGNGGKKPPKKPPTKTGGIPEKPEWNDKPDYSAEWWGKTTDRAYIRPEDYKKEK